MNTILWFLLTALCSPYLLLTVRKRPQRRKILIIQWAKLGDMVCTTPMFRAIKTAHPEWEVHLLCRSSNLRLLEGNPHIDCVITFNGNRSGLVRSLRSQQYDAVINCLPGSFWSMLGLWLRAPDRINTSSSRHGHIIRWSSIFNTVNTPYVIGTSTFNHYLSLLTPLGIPRIPYALDFFVSRDEAAVAKSFIQQHGLHDRAYAVFNVSAGNAIKEWPEEKFVQLIDQTDMPVVLSTLDTHKVARIRSVAKHPERIIDGSSLPLGPMAMLCATAKVFVGVDTGPLYIAHAVGAPIVAIVGGSDVREQLPPVGPKVIHVMPPADCEPWMHVTLSPRTATPQQLRCTRETSVERVAEAVERVLA